MAKIPEHIHAYPRVNPDVVLPIAVPAWDDTNNMLYVGDGKTKGGIPFRNFSDEGKRLIVEKLDGANKIYAPGDMMPVFLKTNINTFYSIRGEDLSLNDGDTKIIIDITAALAVNNLSEFVAPWFVYFAKGEFGEKGEKGKDGKDGEDGLTPIKGVDYLTKEEIDAVYEEMKSYIDNKISNGEW